MNFLEKCNINKKNVFLRIDGNVPLKNGVILDDFRLRAVIPTIEYLINGGATKITIATHLGRPKNHDPLLSTKPISYWFAQKNFSKIDVMENLRFDPREKNLDTVFARELAQGHDIYVNDAWGALHRKETSLTILPTLFSPENRAFGLLVEKEIAALTPLCKNPKNPYLVFLGGKKLPDKLNALFGIVEKKLATTIILLPGIVFTFMAAQGISVGTSLVFPELFEQCNRLLALAKKNNIKIITPDDFLAQDTTNGLIVTGPEFPKTAKGITIGPETTISLKKAILTAKTIFYNGAMGWGGEFDSDVRYQEKLREILTAIVNSTAYTVIGGGDSVEAAEKFGIANKCSWCSTGGGSTLAYISGAQLLNLNEHL